MNNCKFIAVLGSIRGSRFLAFAVRVVLVSILENQMKRECNMSDMKLWYTKPAQGWSQRRSAMAEWGMCWYPLLTEKYGISPKPPIGPPAGAGSRAKQQQSGFGADAAKTSSRVIMAKAIDWPRSTWSRKIEFWHQSGTMPSRAGV